jgi:hypothetical protein
MAREHPFHLAVARTVQSIIDTCGVKDAQLIRDSACGERQQIPLFCSDEKSNETEYCNIDMAIIRRREIVVLIEIEESNIKPTQICGKFLTSALSRCSMHRVYGTRKLGEDVLFLQILDTSKLKRESDKLRQFRHLSESIRAVLPLRHSGVKSYRLLPTTKSELENGPDRSILENVLRGHLCP